MADPDAVCILLAAGPSESCLFTSVTVAGPSQPTHPAHARLQGPAPRRSCLTNAPTPAPGSAVVVLGGEIQKPGQRFHAECGQWRQREGPVAAEVLRPSGGRALLAPARTRRLLPIGDGPDHLPSLRGSHSRPAAPNCLFSCVTGMLGGPPAGMTADHGALPQPNALVTTAVAHDCSSVPAAASAAAAIVDAIDGEQAVSRTAGQAGAAPQWAEALGVRLAERMGESGAALGRQTALALEELVPTRLGSGSRFTAGEATQLHSAHTGLGLRQLCSRTSSVVAQVRAPSPAAPRQANAPVWRAAVVDSGNRAGSTWPGESRGRTVPR